MFSGRGGAFGCPRRDESLNPTVQLTEALVNKEWWIQIDLFNIRDQVKDISRVVTVGSKSWLEVAVISRDLSWLYFGMQGESNLKQFRQSFWKGSIDLKILSFTDN